METRKSYSIIYFACSTLLYLGTIAAEEADVSPCQQGCDSNLESVTTAVNIECQALETSSCSWGIDPVTSPQPAAASTGGLENGTWKWTTLNVSEHTLQIVWPLPQALDVVHGFRVFVQPAASGNQTCVTYSLPSSTTQSSQTTFTYDCYDVLRYNWTYVVTVTSLPGETTLQYTIQTASTGNDVTGTLSDWRSSLAVAVLQVSATESPTSRRLHILFQSAPYTRLNVTKYAVRLSPEKGLRLFVSILLPESSATVGGVCPGTQYKIELLVYGGTDCAQGCVAAALTTFTVQGDGACSSMAFSGSSPGTASSTAADTGTATSTGSTVASYSTADSSVVVQDAAKGDDYDEKIRILSGTMAAVTVLVFAGLAIFCVIRRKRMRPRGLFDRQRLGADFDDEDDIALESSYRQQPSVLLVYSYDCQAHEQVVIELASYLKHAANCLVYLDIWEQNELRSRGFLQWMKDKLQQCQYVIVICSTGARFKCVRNQQFRMKQNRPIQDFFTSAVDHVTAKMQTTANEGETLAQFLVVYFDYAGPSDIPPKLDRAKSYCLMRDIFPLYCHLHGLKLEECKQSDHIGLTADTYTHIDTGAQLHRALQLAHSFFEDHPEWLGEVLEPLSPPATGGQQPKVEQNTQQNEQDKSTQPDGGVTGDKIPATESPRTPSINSEEELLLESRKKKRTEVFEMKARSDSVFGSKREKAQNLKPVSPYLHNGEIPVESPDSSFSTSKHAYSNPLYGNRVSCTDTDDTFIDDDEQLQKDIDFIQNYDHISHKWQQTHSAQNLLITFDLTGGQTPLEQLVQPLGDTWLGNGTAPAMDSNIDFGHPFDSNTDATEVVASSVRL